MRCSEIIARLNVLAPEQYAMEWDNPGLLCGRPEREVTKIMIALDATDEVVAQAVSEGVHMLLTHHPLIFKPIKAVTNQDIIGRRLISLIQADISYYAMHTNYDAAPECMADLAAARLNLSECVPLEVTGEADGVLCGIGKIGMLNKEMTVMQVAEFVKERFGLPFVTVFGSSQVLGAVKRIAVSPGAGGSMIQHALTGGAQVMVTGDISHHQGIDAAASQMAIIDAGHYGIEHIFIEHMALFLDSEFGAALGIKKALEIFPMKVL